MKSIVTVLVAAIATISLFGGIYSLLTKNYDLGLATSFVFLFAIPILVLQKYKRGLGFWTHIENQTKDICFPIPYCYLGLILIESGILGFYMGAFSANSLIIVYVLSFMWAIITLSFAAYAMIILIPRCMKNRKLMRSRLFR